MYVLCKYGDFVVWKENVILRIDLDEDFVNAAIQKVTLFYKHGVLPGKYFTREAPRPDMSTATPEPSSLISAEVSDSDVIEKWCYCGGVWRYEGQNCEIKWFHFNCLKITTAPKGKWFCPDCRKNKPKRSFS